MLTKEEFTKLKKLVRDEVETEGKNTRVEINHSILMTKIKFSEGIDSLKSKVKNVEITTNNIEKDVSVIKKGVKKLQKDLKTTSNFHDMENLKTVKRVEVIERHLGFPEADFA
jgi:hypothetical protein